MLWRKLLEGRTPSPTPSLSRAGRAGLSMVWLLSGHLEEKGRGPSFACHCLFSQKSRLNGRQWFDFFQCKRLWRWAVSPGPLRLTSHLCRAALSCLGTISANKLTDLTPLSGVYLILLQPIIHKWDTKRRKWSFCTLASLSQSGRWIRALCPSCVLPPVHRALPHLTNIQANANIHSFFSPALLERWLALKIMVCLMLPFTFNISWRY